MGSSNELEGDGKSPKVNDEVGRAKSVSITSIVEGGGEVNGKTVSTYLT